eukprot:gene42909-57058_t
MARTGQERAAGQEQCWKETVHFFVSPPRGSAQRSRFERRFDSAKGHMPFVSPARALVRVPRGPPPRPRRRPMKRYWEIDALRGLMLVLMTVTHLPTRLTDPLGQPFGFVSAAEGFVLLSAFVAGLVYSRIGFARGVDSMRQAFWRRVLKVYLCQAAILLFLKPLPVLGVSLYATPWIILFAYMARFLSMAVKPVTAALSQLDLSVEEAASLCGAGFIGRLRHVLLPALLPAMLAGAVFVFLSAFNELTVSALLWSAGTRTLGVILFSFEEAGLTAEASALAVLTMLIVALLMLALDRLGRRLPPGVVPWSA